MLHRDVKAANLLRVDGELVKIGDLGVAKLLSKTAMTHTQIGTPHYMPPEVRAGVGWGGEGGEGPGRTFLERVYGGNRGQVPLLRVPCLKRGSLTSLTRTVWPGLTAPFYACALPPPLFFSCGCGAPTPSPPTCGHWAASSTRWRRCACPSRRAR